MSHEYTFDEIKHDVVIKSRNRIELSGISDVSSYDEKEIIAQTSKCGVTIEGEGLKIERFNSENAQQSNQESITRY
mgnify:CR=1 FL=1